MLAHAVGSDALPAPSWLLAYLGVALVLATAAALRATWPRARATPAEPATLPAPAVHAGHVAGTLLYGLIVAVAIVGPDSSGANLAPWAVAAVAWVVMPLLCLVLGDVVATVNPFLLPVALLDRRGRRPQDGDAARPAGPAWTAAALLGAWLWYLLAYHRPGSPRALAVFLVAYAVAAVAGGLVWGRAWLRTGEAFGAISAAAGRLGVRGRDRHVPLRGVALLMVVWIGGTAFDGFTFQTFWQEVLVGRRGWEATLVNTAGLVWMAAIAGGAFLAVTRVAERGQRDQDVDRRLGEPLGWALAPLAVGWFLGHDLTLLLADGQNAYVLASDPFGRGWDLFGTIDHAIDFTVLDEPWVAWAQVVLIAAGHVATVVLLHELVLERLPARAAMRATWAMAVVTAGSIVAAALLVLA